MVNQERYYQESGEINIKKQFLSYLICIALAFVLGYIYSVLIAFIPFIYINFLITLGFGILLGIICNFFVKISHNRSKKSLFIHAIIIGLFANYFQWISHVILVYNGEIVSLENYFLNFLIFINPINFIEAIIEINKVGTWQLGSVNFFGLGLTVVWIIEFALILLGSILAIQKRQIFPYSELQKKWYSKYTLNKEFRSISGVLQFTEDLLKNPIETIDSLEMGNGSRYSKIYIFYLKEENKQYISFDKTYLDGKNKKITEKLVNNLIIPKKVCEMILEKYENKVVKNIYF